MSNIKGENITKDPICVLLSVVDHISFLKMLLQSYSVIARNITRGLNMMDYQKGVTFW